MADVPGAGHEIEYNPMLPGVRADPYPSYRYLRETDPVHFNSYARMWFLARHDHCTLVLRDRRFSAALGQEMRQQHGPAPRSMLNTDAADHTRLRRPFNSAFGREVLAQLRPAALRAANNLLDRLVTPAGVDLVSGFAQPFAAHLLAELLGVAPEDFETFSQSASRSAGLLDPLAPPQSQGAARSGAAALQAYFTRRISAASHLDTSFMGRLLKVAGSARVTPEELAAGCVLMVVGGYQPLADFIGNGLFVLLRHPEQLDNLCRNPGLIESAVEELLRFESPIQFTTRVATEEIALAGKTVLRGQPVVVLFGAANRDPAVFHDPERLDLARSPNPHLGLGGGPHFCLGAPLVRLGGAIALQAAVSRFPHMQLATAAPGWRDSLIPRGLKSLPVAF